MTTNLTPEGRARGRRKVAQKTAADAIRRAESYRWVLEPLAATDLSLPRIAEVLNERRIASPGYKRWHRENVRRVLKRLGLYAVA